MSKILIVSWENSGSDVFAIGEAGTILHLGEQAEDLSPPVVNNFSAENTKVLVNEAIRFEYSL